MNYLIAQILICLGIAALIGLAIGWFLWGSVIGRLRRSLSASQLEAARSKEFTASAKNLKDSLAAKDLELVGLHGALSEKDAHVAALRARIAELEPLHAQATEAQLTCQDQLALREQKIESLQHELQELNIQHSALIAAQEETSTTSAAHKYENVDLQERLHSANKRSDSLAAHIQELEPVAALVPALQDQIAEHVKAQTAKDARIAELEPLVEQLNQAKAAKDVDIESLLESQIAAEARITELEPLAARVPDLEAQVAHHVHAHQTKDSQINALLNTQAVHTAHMAELEPLAGRIPELEAALSDKTTEVESLQLRIAKFASSDTAKDDSASDQGGNLADLHSQINALSTSLAELREEHAAALDELAILRAEFAAKAIAQPEPPKAMAAVAGFSEASSSSVSSVPSAGITQLQDKIDQYEGRIKQLETWETEKDQEILNLRQSLQAPISESDTKKQIVAGARATEVKHLRRILNGLIEPIDSDTIAKRAFRLSEERGFVGGSDTEDWIKAERELHNERLRAAKVELTPQGLF